MGIHCVETQIKDKVLRSTTVITFTGNSKLYKRALIFRQYNHGPLSFFRFLSDVVVARLK